MKLKDALSLFELDKRVGRLINKDYYLDFTSKTNKLCLSDKFGNTSFLTREDVNADDWMELNKEKKYYALLQKLDNITISEDLFYSVEDAERFYKGQYRVVRLITDIPDLYFD